MPRIEVLPATADRFDDAEHALTGGGDGHSCQCQWWTLTNAEFNATTLDERTDLLREQMGDKVPPALIAYVDGEAAGWVRVSPRTVQPRLQRTREYAAHTREDWDDPSVWAVSCFVVRREYRRQGLNHRLLEAAVQFAREQGARVLEAYPRDPREVKQSSNELYHGVLSVFEDAGFETVARPKAGRAIVALDLTR
ncbi:GNAT family N-acetyltransferase [Microbacterium sp.]|uniref:GNAT family N-acetyltransferase n=1 Tax=Microbacterium sp. TaxID=51671 RepID=UPI002D77F694|nr:GNAT family N-acetyltransferase [Microbacterium sp.]HET6303079.1 GNAT family N-acetyltransferase [Microbacterium sp.]